MVYDFKLEWSLFLIVALFGAIQGTCAYLILLERKLSAWVQDRVGPNRVGPFGLLQPIVDGAKFLLKEDIVPSHVDKLMYILAPAIALSTAFLAISVVPFGPTSTPPELPVWHTTANDAQFQAKHTEIAEYNDSYQFVLAPNVNIGILFTFAVTSLAVYGIILGGWSSNNKYSVLGALRSSAQLISYELPMGMSVLGVVLLTGSLNLEKIISAQTRDVWFICYQPLAFLMFLTAIFAECNRLPFDLPEAEQELVGGYHTEYSAMKFALFFLGEYTHMITTSFIAVALFFGGWHLWGVSDIGGLLGLALKIAIFGGKMFAFIVFYMLIRWTIPRFRFDQLMSIAWKVLIPLAVLNFVSVLVVQHLVATGVCAPSTRWLLLPISLGLLLGAGLVTLRQAPVPKKSIRVMRGHQEIEITV